MSDIPLSSEKPQIFHVTPAVYLYLLRGAHPPAYGLPPARWRKSLRSRSQFLKCDESTLSVYVHWPFCASKCPYCDFNSHVRDSVNYTLWNQALLAELRHYLNITPHKPVYTVFFGGGTPSLMPPEIVHNILTELKLYGLAQDAEITLEANPGSVDVDKFRAFREAGINRVSIGLQSLNNASLKFLGREHSADDGLAALEAARIFGRYSFDLIFGLPGQTIAQWQAELNQALKLAGGHISLYQLTIEQGTRFYHLHQAGKLNLPENDTLAGFYEATVKIAGHYGYEAYEVSNFAKPGHECRHNLHYWQYGDYIGIGPGAHGRINIDGQRTATAAEKSPEKWLERTLAGAIPAASCLPLTRQEQVMEMVLMSLRTRQGLDLQRLELISATTLDNVLNMDAIAEFTRQGYLELTSNNLKATSTGFMVLDMITAAVLR